MNDSIIGLALIAGVAVMYLRKSEPESMLYISPSTEREVDVSRWRHDGTQPTTWTKGNGASFNDEVASKLLEEL